MDLDKELDELGPQDPFISGDDLLAPDERAAIAADRENEMINTLNLWGENQVKGMVYLRSREDFISFLHDLNSVDGPLCQIEDWAAFFCSELKDINGYASELTAYQLIDSIDPHKEPKKFPCLIAFDFDRFYAGASEDTAVWMFVSLEDLGVRMIETDRDDWSIYYTG